jgi:hypothetical protein
MSDGITVLSDEQVEEAVWSFFYQLSRSRDRRRTPVPGPDGEDGPKIVVNAATGLPESIEDLVPKNMAISGIKLAMSAIVPPERLAASCIQDLPDGIEPTEANWIRYGKALALKPRPEWTDENLAVFEANALRFKIVVHRLAEEHGYFNVRPIDPKDKDMHDLKWEDEAGFTLGFALTMEGWHFMQKVVVEKPHLQRVCHVLDYAGQDVREKAPQWARDEWNALHR